MNIKNQKNGGMTLVEVLVVAAIISIIGGISGLFLLKYLPEYHLRSAASALSQDIRQTQIGALRSIRTWNLTFDVPNNRYIITDSGTGIIKTVNLSSFGDRITLVAANSTSFTAEGTTQNQASIVISNSLGKTMQTDILLSGTVRVR